MKRIVLLLTVVSGALLSLGGGAWAQGFYFGIGPRYYDPPPRYYGGPRYRAYGGDDCYWVTRRRYNEYRGVWVVRRVRVCD
jgi:hypothetical protein